MSDPFDRPAMVASVFYKDPAAALAWLAKAFGFACTMVIRDAQGTIVHSEMRFGAGLVHVGGEWSDFAVSAATVEGRSTQVLHVAVAGSVDDHCATARQAGATILMEPTDQFYGDRAYRARDPEGHVWVFWQHLRRVPKAEAEQASGLIIDCAGWD